MSKKICLMLECKDKVIFTSKKHTNVLTEFVKEFDLKAHYAKTEEENIIPIEKIPEIFCSQQAAETKEYSIVKENILTTKKTRKKILETAANIKEEMEKYILKNKIIKFSELQKKFENKNLSVSALNNLFRQTRKNISEKGFEIEKIKNGLYKIS